MGVALCAAAAAAERRSWNQIRYVGGTVEIETTRFDNNTTLTLSPALDAITIRIAPAKLRQKEQVLTLQPSQIVSLSAGTAAWRRAREIAGAKLPPHSPSLFGLLQDTGYFAISFEDAGRRSALLFYSGAMWEILTALGKVSGKDIEVAH